MVNSKKRNMYEEFIKCVPLLSTMEHYELMKIIDAVKAIEYQAGTTIIKEVISRIMRQGDQGDAFFLLESGEAYATKQMEIGKEAKKVLEYKKGSYFGELALLKNAPRAASVVAKVIRMR